MKRLWVRSVSRVLVFTFVLAYVIPFGALAGWCGLTRWESHDVRQSATWPCGPWKPGLRRHVADGLYRIYYVATTPGRAFVVARYPELERYFRDSWAPSVVAVCSDYSLRQDLVPDLRYFGGPTFLFWLPILGVFEVVRRRCFGPAASYKRRVTATWVLGATFAFLLGAVVVARIVIGMGSGRWAWPFPLGAALTILTQSLLLAAAARRLRRRQGGVIPGWLGRLIVATPVFGLTMLVVWLFLINPASW